MANTKSAEKRIRQNEKRRVLNRSHRSRMRTAIKHLRNAVASGDVELAQKLLPETISLVDATAQKGVIHQNTASRTVSRLTRAVRALG